MSTLLVVHHTVSPATEQLLDAVLAGARTDDLEGVEVVVRAALAATVPDLLAADGYLLLTPACIGYMSGALKHVFDQAYYPVRHEKRGAAYGLAVHGNLGTEGAQRSVHGVATGLGWRQAAADVVVTGAPDRDDLQRCWELGATLAAATG